MLDLAGVVVNHLSMAFKLESFLTFSPPPIAFLAERVLFSSTHFGSWASLLAVLATLLSSLAFPSPSSHWKKFFPLEEEEESSNEDDSEFEL